MRQQQPQVEGSRARKALAALILTTPLVGVKLASHVLWISTFFGERIANKRKYCRSHSKKLVYVPTLSTLEVGRG